MHRIARTLVVSLLLLACGPGHAEPDVDAEPDARAYVAKTCGGCHPGPQLETMVRRRLERGPSPSLVDFLATHHVPDRAQRDLVSSYLERIAAGASGIPTP